MFIITKLFSYLVVEGLGSPIIFINYRFGVWADDQLTLNANCDQSEDKLGRRGSVQKPLIKSAPHGVLAQNSGSFFLSPFS